MRKTTTLFLLIFMVRAALADDDTHNKKVSLSAELLNMLALRNDTDFDRTEPFYNKYGQEMGFLGTFLKPMLTLHANDYIKLYWEAEIGLDLWSRSNPEISLNDRNSSNALGIKQREIYGEVNSNGLVLKAGFQRVVDISTLFINHWIGALRLGYQEEEYGIYLLGGQFPDQTYKGWDLTSSSFMTDVFVIGLDGYYNLLEELKLKTGIYFVDDLHLIDRRRQITALEGGIGYKIDDLEISLSSAYLRGYRQKGGVDLKNTGISAYSFIANLAYIYENTLKVEGVFSYMSADDKYEGNDSGAFLFGSRRIGPSVILSENDTRPIGDNIDKKIGAPDGVFYEMKAGLIGLDIGVYYINNNWLRIGPISCILMTANEDNSLGSSFVAWENNIIAEALFFDSKLSTQILMGVLIPGKAGAAAINSINKTDYKDTKGNEVSVTEPIYYLQTGITIRY
ncbi:MAG: hypothetical protein N2746_05525 [Deltaproteobacteria bacterium]|nr:hypothetical protein [Deltaproteobacteria bacterium]